MTQEEKQLLLKDLCARLPYGFKAHIIGDGFYDEREPYDTNISITNHHLVIDLYADNGLTVLPYLRSLRNITDEEMKELEKDEKLIFAVSTNGLVEATQYGFDWLNVHHFDYRGLIEKGLAFEAPDGMYKEK